MLSQVVPLRATVCCNAPEALSPLRARLRVVRGQEAGCPASTPHSAACCPSSCFAPVHWPPTDARNPKTVCSTSAVFVRRDGALVLTLSGPPGDSFATAHCASSSSSSPRRRRKGNLPSWAHFAAQPRRVVLRCDVRLVPSSPAPQACEGWTDSGSFLGGAGYPGRRTSGRRTGSTAAKYRPHAVA